MEKQEYTQANFDDAYNKIKDQLPEIIKRECNTESLKTILRDVLANEYAESIANYKTMLEKLTVNSDLVYRRYVLAIVYPYTDLHPDETIKKIIENLYNPDFSYRQMRNEYETPSGLVHCLMGFVALQMKKFDQRRLEEIERRELAAAALEREKSRRPLSQPLSHDEKELRRKAVDAQHKLMISGQAPVTYDENDEPEPNPYYTAVIKPPPSGAQGGSRRRRRTSHRKRKSHRKSKRVHHTRRKHTRKHRHSHRRHHRH
jgi:hypothetical protein